MIERRTASTDCYSVRHRSGYSLLNGIL